MIDNIFIDAARNYTIKPHINGLSDHDAQILTISNFFVPNINTDPYYTRIINKNTIAEFQQQLSWERWDDVFGLNDVNGKFNTFLNTYLRLIIPISQLIALNFIIHMLKQYKSYKITNSNMFRSYIDHHQGVL